MKYILTKEQANEFYKFLPKLIDNAIKGNNGDSITNLTLCFDVVKDGKVVTDKKEKFKFEIVKNGKNKE
jgi:hypothetical protein